MINDQQLILSDAQTVSANAASTNYLDSLAMQDLMAGEPLHALVAVKTISGTSPTLQIQLQAADDAAFGTNLVTLGDTGALTLTDPQIVRVPHRRAHPNKRYYRYNYIVGGTSPSFVVTAGFTKDLPTSKETVL